MMTKKKYMPKSYTGGSTILPRHINAKFNDVINTLLIDSFIEIIELAHSIHTSQKNELSKPGPDVSRPILTLKSRPAGNNPGHISIER